MPRILLDTGPLVALLSAREAQHSWVTQRFSEWTEPCVTCEPVLTESFHLLAKVRGAAHGLARRIDRAIRVKRALREPEDDARVRQALPKLEKLAPEKAAALRKELAL